MGILKDIIDDSTGASLGYHKINGYNVDFLTNNLFIQIGSYISKETADAGKSNLSTYSYIIQGTDDLSLDFMYRELVGREDSPFYQGTVSQE